MCLSVPVFNPTVLHHITILKCVNGCPKIIVDAALDADLKLQFPGLHAHLTLMLAIVFSVGVFEKQGLCQYSRY
jgi:hypothetical protein